MRALGALGALGLLAMGALAACDDGPDPVPGDVHVTPHDMQPDPPDDAEMGPPDMRADIGDTDASDPRDMRPDGDAGVEPDGGESPCRVPDRIVPGDVPFADRAWRVDVPMAGHPGRTAPACGDALPGLTAGAEASVRVEPLVDGSHLIAVAGGFSALYGTTPCDIAPVPGAEGCLIGYGSFEGGATRSGRVDAVAGQPFDVIADAPAGEQAGPVRVWIYPPVDEGSSCAPIAARGPRPTCVDGLACDRDVCAYAGPPRVDGARAWTDGQSLRIAAEISGRVLVGTVWVRPVGDADAEFVQVLLTSAEDEPFARRLKGYIEEPGLAGSPRVEIEAINADGEAVRAIVDVARLEPSEIGDPCDGIRDVCAPGDACVAGRCESSLAGTWLTEAGAVNIDVQMPGAPLPDPQVIAVVRPRGADFGAPWVALPERLAEVGRRWTARDVALPAQGIELRINQPGLPPGLPVGLLPQPQPVLGEGQVCDPDGIANRCGVELACLLAEPESSCVATDPPVILEARAWAGPGSLGVKVTFADPQDDTEAYRFSVRDADGELVYETDEPVPLPERAQGVFEDSMLAPWGPEVGDLLTIELIDATGRVSRPREAVLEAPVGVALGVACDPLGARSFCIDDDVVCAVSGVERVAQCVLFEAECPERWRPLPLRAPTRWDDNTTGGPDRTAGLCGGVGSPEGIYQLTAQRDSRWRISVQPQGAAVYVRTHCRFALPVLSELVCARAPVEVDVEAGETYYVFVDGPVGGGRFSLLIDEVPPPPP